MNKAVCRVFLVISLNILGIVLLILSQNASAIVNSFAGMRAVLSAGSRSARSFAHPSVPIHRKFYFFDLKNKEAVLQGATPILQEMGPYVFKVKSEKEMRWKGDRITFEPRKTYFFEPSESAGNLSEMITSINPGSVTAARFEPSLITDLFDTATVGEFLFDGVRSSDNTTDENYGYFKGKNGTSEGIFEVLTGQGGNIDDLNRIISVNGRTSLDCEELRGTNGERFPPFSIPPPKLTLYNPTLCRPWDLHYDGIVNLNGVECARYSNGRDFFSRTFNETFDACFEERSNGKDVGIRGILNSQNCQNTIAPILYSLPHFLDADPEVRGRLTGIQPSKTKHNFFLDVYPALGFVINMRIRVQVNFRLKRVGEYARNSKMQEIIYPVFWQELMLLKENSDAAAAIVYKRVVVPQRAMFWIFLLLGILSITASTLLLLSDVCLQWLSASHAVNHDAFVSYNPGSGRSQVSVR